MKPLRDVHLEPNGQWAENRLFFPVSQTKLSGRFCGVDSGFVEKPLFGFSLLLIRSVGVDVERHLEAADAILAAFEEHDLARRLDTPDETGRLYDLRGAEELAASFDRPLIPFVRAAIGGLDPEDPDYGIDPETIFISTDQFLKIYEAWRTGAGNKVTNSDERGF